MKKKLSEISGYFKDNKLRNDKRVIIYLVCVFIATVLWFLNALEKDYTTNISYPVKFVNPPKNQFLSNTPPDRFDLEVRAHGFSLLRHKLSFSFSPIVLNINNLTRDVEKQNGVYTIRTNNFRQRIADQISSEISLNTVRPEYFELVLDSLKTRQVSVESRLKLGFKPQFNLAEPIKISPSKVAITGPAVLLDTLTKLYTEEKLFDKLDAASVKTLAIVYPENTTVSPEKVKITIPVEKFTEKELKIPIAILNKPENVKIKLFPSDIKCSVLVGLSEFENISAANFSAVVDYNNISTGTENLEVKIVKKPLFVEVLRFSPNFVEFLIETN